MPTIRTVRATDLVPLIAFVRNHARQEVSARVWPRVREDSGWNATWRALAPIVTAPGGNPHALVYASNGSVRGLVVARPRVGGIAWDVEELHLIGGDWLAGVDILDYLAVGASRRGARRVFLTTPPDVDTVRIAKQAGFVNYASESLYLMQLTARVESDSLTPPRPRLRHDTQPLFQLYNSAVPCRVRSAEALTMDEWLLMHRAGAWAPGLRRSRQDLVWEEDGSVAAWLRVAENSSSVYFELMVDPSHLGETERMVRYSLSRTARRVPVYASVRQYQPDLASALERVGFTRVADYLVFARELTARVPNRVLVPARA